jgi:DNA polymerase IV
MLCVAELRRILHCDMDCFYAAVHMRDDPRLQGQPVVIGGDPGGRGVVAAASYEARAFGVRSAMPAARAVRLCPRAVFLRPDFPRYRRESEAIFAIYREFTPLIQPVALDEAYLDVSEQLGAWGTATAVAREIRRRVRAERGLTVSVGVGPSRLVAKIASDFKKPDGLTVVPPERVRDFLDPLPVRTLPGVGPATEKVLLDLGVATVADLAARPLEEIQQRFGRHGALLHRFANGEDQRPVEVSRERKSLGQERTYARDLAELDAMDAELGRLAERVAEGLDRRGLAGRTVTVKVRYADFSTVTRAHSLAQPTSDAAEIARHALALLRQTEAPSRPVRLLGVTVSGFGTPVGEVQLELFEDRDPQEAAVGAR